MKLRSLHQGNKMVIFTNDFIPHKTVVQSKFSYVDFSNHDVPITCV